MSESTVHMDEQLRDELFLTKGRLGWIGRARLTVGLVLGIAAAKMYPPEVRDLIAEQYHEGDGDEDES